jgi:hypothetical protein
MSWEEPWQVASWRKVPFPAHLEQTHPGEFTRIRVPLVSADAGQQDRIRRETLVKGLLGGTDR